MLGPWVQKAIWVRHNEQGVVVRLTSENPYNVVGIQEEEPIHSDHDNCVWDDNRIESTKTVLFQEALAEGRV